MAVSEDIYLVECAAQIVYAVLFYIHEVISEKYIWKESQSFIDAARVTKATRDMRGMALYTQIVAEFYRKGKDKDKSIFNQMVGFKCKNCYAE